MPFSPDNLRIFREAAGLSQIQLGKKLGVGNTAICHWETGRRSPDQNRLTPLATILGVSREDLLDGGGE